MPLLNVTAPKGVKLLRIDSQDLSGCAIRLWDTLSHDRPAITPSHQSCIFLKQYDSVYSKDNSQFKSEWTNND